VFSSLKPFAMIIINKHHLKDWLSLEAWEIEKVILVM
jgi:hypothetical protein